METTNLIGIAIFAACMLAILGPLSWSVFVRDSRKPVATDVLSANCFGMGHESNQALKRAPKLEYDPESDSLRLAVSDSRVLRKHHLATGLIVDLDENGTITGFELLSASRAVSAPTVIEPRARQGGDQQR